MKNLKWVLIVLVLALGGYFIFQKMKASSAAGKRTSPTASTGTFSGFDNFFSGLLNKPNYNPGGTAANNISGIIDSANGVVNSLGRLFGVTRAAPVVPSPAPPVSSVVPPDALNPASWSPLSTTPDWSNPSYYSDPNSPGYVPAMNGNVA